MMLVDQPYVPPAMPATGPAEKESAPLGTAAREHVSLLSISGLTAGYGDVQVLWGVDLQVKAGAITCIVGSNGAGKSTLLRTISGMVRVNSGTINFAGRDLTGATPDAMLSAGVAHVPEGRRLFRGLSIRDNLLLGAYMRNDSRAEIEHDLEFIYSMFPILKEREKQDATTLSGGEQQMCAIGRGIMSRPQLLMIDELSLGLAPRAVEKLGEALLEINRAGLTILLVEQDVLTAFDLASQAFVVETGRVSLSGSTAELAEDPRIRQAYMGI
ncbi:ABC transporter ATP-binding protein [Lacisediminimonas profundi]|uniref:ABC transporter ATP-binding protein n=1 Tax=Lacisediminimonas profundi TaxID=2603856 RepID=UPI001F4F1112|nr:ABC transporter ATP-binding protein [Lacisediminimonas profundi]